MRRRPSTPSVTLFPFLAVLVCTMGALIFLLLVITQKIQKQSQLPLVTIEAPAIEDIVLEPPEVETNSTGSFIPLLEPDVIEIPTVPIVEIDDDEPILPLLAGNTVEDHVWLQNEWEARRRARQQEYERLLHARNQEQQRIENELKKQAEQLALAARKNQEEKERLLTQLAKSQQELAMLDEQKTSASQNAALTKKQFEEAERAHQREQTKRFELQALAADLTRQIARLEEQNANALPATEIVAYDSITGTARKPILIECKQSEIIFASEGVVLSAVDLSGFPPEYNPLKAGAEALLNYWKENGESHERPYILLVVRPEGTTGFYVARGLLSELDHKFGYELVETDREIRWPETDPEAMEVCRAAVLSVMNERERVAAKVGRLASLNDGPLSYSNAQGNFHLPEAEGSNRSGNENFIGDEKWISPNSRKRQSSNFAGGNGNRQPPQHGDVPRSIARPTPTESATPLFDGNNREESSAQSGQPSSLSATEEFSNQSQQSSTTPRQMPQTFTADGARPLASEQTLPPLPVNPFEQSAQEQQSEAEPNYGVQIKIPRRTGIIGIERETELHLWPNQFQIDDETALRIPAGVDSMEFKKAVTAAIANSTSEWDSPPKSYFWKPVVKIVIHPGGLLHYAAVKELTDLWGIPTKVEYELN